MIFLSFVTFLIIFIKSSLAQCNVCNLTSLTACISVDQFVPCDINGVLNFNTVTSCALGSQCNQNLPTAPCTPGVVVACNSNHVPVPSTTTVPTTVSTSSTSSTTSTTSTRSTTSTAATTTTLLSSFTASTYCSSKALGRYKHPSLITCTSYVYCYSYNSTMTGAVYTCPSSTNFNPVTAYCDPNYIC
ncbi:hypothetical protein PVAND_005164 [Polypedilum vanderplanki]|uniref:Chitin-binding type-2 domain-containing protein n=1 Tax=Polypedilum vanderplanki TaxID=319348 RepID=A0A9J6BZ39_POLVA|nr:hypothetical protein PVAND_005164 [Polypedilum vanderplanki]